MIELERRALLGDKQAQEECTRRGIVLPCPFCGGRAEKDYILGKIYFWSDDNPSDGYYTYCTGVECPTFGSYSRYYRTEREAILAWNTRPAPPLHRCVECEKYLPIRNEEYGCSDLSGLKELMETGICNKFESKKGDTV